MVATKALPKWLVHQNFLWDKCNQDEVNHRSWPKIESTFATKKLKHSQVPQLTYFGISTWDHFFRSRHGRKNSGLRMFYSFFLHFFRNLLFFIFSSLFRNKCGLYLLLDFFQECFASFCFLGTVMFHGDQFWWSKQARGREPEHLERRLCASGKFFPPRILIEFSASAQQNIHTAH